MYVVICTTHITPKGKKTNQFKYIRPEIFHVFLGVMCVVIVHNIYYPLQKKNKILTAIVFPENYSPAKLQHW